VPDLPSTLGQRRIYTPISRVVAHGTLVVALLLVLACGGSSSGTGGIGNTTCIDAPLPAATTDCKVAGTYQFHMTPRCPNTCEKTSDAFGPVTITTDGTSATGKFLRPDGTTSFGFEIACTLNGCDCTDPSGDHFVFTHDGLHGDGQSTDWEDAGVCTSNVRFTATRQ